MRSDIRTRWQTHEEEIPQIFATLSEEPQRLMKGLRDVLRGRSSLNLQSWAPFEAVPIAAGSGRTTGLIVTFLDGLGERLFTLAISEVDSKLHFFGEKLDLLQTDLEKEVK
jgi:hypothetical protein